MDMKRFFIVLLAIGAAAELSYAQTVITSDASAGQKSASWRIAVDGGGVYRLGKTNSDSDVLEQHAKKLKWGYSYGAEATFFFTEPFGVGVKYRESRSSNKEMVSVDYSDGRASESGVLEDCVCIRFIGPMLQYRLVGSSGKGAFLMDYGLGYMSYRDDAQLIRPFSMTGGTLGTFFDLGYDISLSKHFALGAAASIMTGTLSSITVADSSGNKVTERLDKDSYQSLGGIYLSIGLRWLL